MACHVQAYLHMYDVTRGLRKNGTFLLNTIWEGDELAKNLPNKVKKYFAENNITVYYINATQIAQEIGLGKRTNTILQSAFFRITGVIPVDLAVEQMKKFIVKSYGKKGEDVVNKNYAAVDRGGEYKQLTVDPAWANLEVEPAAANNDPAFINEVVRPINAQDGDLLPVSAFKASKTVPGIREQPNTKNAVWLLSFRNGILKTVSSVTSVHTFVLTQLSVRSYSMQKNRRVQTSLP